MSYLATPLSWLGRIFIPNVRTKSIVTAVYSLLKATSQEEPNTSYPTCHIFRLTFAVGGRNHTNRLQQRLGIGFRNACSVYIRDTDPQSSNMAQAWFRPLFHKLNRVDLPIPLGRGPIQIQPSSQPIRLLYERDEPISELANPDPS